MNNMSDAMINLFSRQISHEFKNHQVYRFFANRLCNIGLNKISLFLINQANDELSHAEQLIAYCDSRNIDIDFEMVEKIDLGYETILDVAKQLLEVEKTTTSMLKEMVMCAWNDMDLLTYEWLMSGLIKEQTEEENTIQTLVDMITNIGDNMVMIQLFDNTFAL